MKFLDANIFLRYLVADDSVKADACFTLFQRLNTGQDVATTSEAVIAEVAYVLRSRAHYDLAPAEIEARLRPLLALRGLKLAHKRTYLSSLEIWNAYPKLDFEDALTVAHMDRLGLQDILHLNLEFADSVFVQVRKELG